MPQRILNPVVFNNSNTSKLNTIRFNMSYIATPLGKTIEKDDECQKQFTTTNEGNESTASLKQNLFNNRLMMDFAFSDKKSINNNHH